MGTYVAAFYDSVVRPETQETSAIVQFSVTDSVVKSWSGKLGVEASLGSILSKLLPGLKAGVEVQKGTEEGHADTRTVTLELQPITNPYRQLVHLVIYYMSLVDRFQIVRPNEAEPTWLQDEVYILDSPRPLILLDLPPTTMLIPMAAELGNGLVVTFFDQIALKFAKHGEAFVPEYTQPEPGKDLAAVSKANIEYWNWFRENFNPGAALRIVEQTIGDRGPIAWIDYRMPLGEDGRTIHLHVCGRKQYDTGVFAYNMIKRGYTHGLRVMGTLKTEPDMNVLAIFDK